MGIKTSELTAVTALDSSSGYFVVDTGSATNKMSRGDAAECLKDTFGLGHAAAYGGVPAGKEITDDWAAIQTNIANNKHYIYHVGDYIKLSLSAVTGSSGEVICNAQTLYMTVMGNDTYWRAGSTSIDHHIDFISSAVLSSVSSNPWVYNSTATNNGTADESNPWLASDLYTRLNDETYGVIAGLSEVSSYITEKQAYVETRYSSAGELSYSTGGKWANMGKLWLPTEIEVFGTAHCSDAFGNDSTSYSTQRGGGCNIQYPFFAGRSPTATSLGRSGNWWLASAARGSSTYFCFVSGGGYAGYLSATSTTPRVPVCFRIGGTAYTAS